MENEIKKKSNKGFIITIITLTLLVIALSGYIGYDKLLNYNSKTNNNIIKENDNQKNELVSLEITDKDVLKAMKTFNQISTTTLFEKDKYDINNDITKYDLIATATRNSNIGLSGCVFDKERQKVTIEEFNSYLTNLVRNKSFTIEDIKSLEKATFSIESYAIGRNGIIVNSDNTIEIIMPCGYEGGPGNFTESKIVKAEKDDKNLYIYEKKQFFKYIDYSYETSESKYDVFDNPYYTGTAKENCTSSGFFPDEYIKSKLDWNLYNTYKYTFTKYEGIYYFETFELVK